MSGNEPNFQSLSELNPDEADDRRQREVGRSISGAVPDHLKSGRMVSGSLKDAGEVAITHGLKRVPKGWYLVAPSGDADRVSVVQSGSDSNVLKLKNLGATGTLNFQIWVF